MSGRGGAVILNRGWVVSAPPPVVLPEKCWFCEDPGPEWLRTPGVGVAFHPIPAVGIEGSTEIHREGLRVWRDGVGAHELIYGRKGHTLAGIAGLFEVGRERIRDLRRDGRLRGFSLGGRFFSGGHPVLQLIALPFESPLAAAADFRDEELGGPRMLERREGAVGLMAWAPRVPFECWFLPDRGRERFDRGGEGVFELLEVWLPRLMAALPGCWLDVVVVDGEPWRVVVLPGGWERSVVEVTAGVPVHGGFPEDGCEFLRR